MTFIGAIVHKTKTHYIIRKLDLSKNYSKFARAATEVYSIRILSLPSELRKICDQNILYDQFYREHGQKIIENSINENKQEENENDVENEKEEVSELFQKWKNQEKEPLSNKKLKKILLKHLPKYPEGYDKYVDKIAKIEFQVAHRQTSIGQGLVSVKNIKFLGENDVNGEKQGMEVVSPRLLAKNDSEINVGDNVNDQTVSTEASDHTLRSIIEKGEESDLTNVTICTVKDTTKSRIDSGQGSSEEPPQNTKFDFSDLLTEFNLITKQIRAGKMSKIPNLTKSGDRPQNSTITREIPKFCQKKKGSKNKKSQNRNKQQPNSEVDWFGEEIKPKTDFKAELEKVMAQRNKLCSPEILKKFEKFEKGMDLETAEGRQAAICFKNFVEMSATICKMGK